MCGDGVKNPIMPIQRIVPYFNLIQRYLFSEEIRYLAFWFLKEFYNIYIYIYKDTHTHMSVFIYL